MRLELGTFPVRDAIFGAQTRWADGLLEIDKEEMLALARGEGIVDADVDLARPGQPVRIVNLTDVVEPRVKVEGPGMVYPGLCGRPVATVGRGRTHRLGGFAVVECAGSLRGQGAGQPDTTPRGQIARRQDFIDMAGPGAVRPYAALINLVLTLEADPGLNVEDRHLATHGASLRIADRLAATVAHLDPPEREDFDLTTRDPALPGIVFIPLLSSHEFWAGPDSRVGYAVYGVTRLSAPWVLHPTELMDGAVSQGTSWPLINNPLVMELARRHGRELNFLAVIVHRSNWGSQAEMELAAYRDAQAAVLLGARGAIVTTNIRGRRFVDVVACIRACEAEGIQTVLVTEEEDSEEGAATPLLINDPAIVAAVSTGTGAVPEPFSPVERVLGARAPDPLWYGQLPPLAGRYGAHHIQDHYGYGRQSCADW
jgi:glycine reductase